MKLQDNIALLLIGSKHGLKKLDSELVNIPMQHLQINVDCIPLRYETITGKKPGSFALLELHTSMINFLRNEFHPIQSKQHIDRIIKLCQEKVLFYHNTQFNDSSNHSELPQKSENVGSKTS